MKTRFIFNPVSGRHARNARLLPILRDFIGARALDADLVATEGPGHATVLAREAVNAGCARVVAVGGDGTMNEVAQALIHTPAALALVPCGSGNGLALHLGLPLAPLAALELVAAIGGRVAAVDTGSVNGHPFFNAMGLGLDADVSRRFTHLTTRGLPAYARTALTAFAQRRSEHCIVQTGSTRESLEILLIAVANSDQYGNRAYIAPGARVDDGQLDLVAIRPVGLLGAMSLGARLFLGNIDASPFVRVSAVHASPSNVLPPASSTPTERRTKPVPPSKSRSTPAACASSSPSPAAPSPTPLNPPPPASPFNSRDPSPFPSGRANR